MDHIVSESGGIFTESGKELFPQEDVFIPITDSEEKKYIKNEGMSFKLSSNLVNVNKQSVLSESTVHILDTKKRNDKNLDKLVSESVNYYLSKM